MKLEAIFEEWGKDVVIDRLDLCKASLDIPKLHNKYLRMISGERLIMRKQESDLSILKDAKKSWMDGSISREELNEKGWSPWLHAKPLRNEIDDLIAVEPDIVSAKLRLDIQKEKVDVLDSIIKMLINRSFHINNAIAALKFENGVA